MLMRNKVDPIHILIVLLLLILVAAITSYTVRQEILKDYCVHNGSEYVFVHEHHYCWFDDDLLPIEWMRGE